MDEKMLEMYERMEATMLKMQESHEKDRKETMDTLHNMERKLDTAAADLKQNVKEQLAEMKVTEQFETLNNKVSSLQTALEKSEFARTVTEERLEKVEASLGNVANLVHNKFEDEKDILAQEVTKRVTDKINIAWKANLTRDVAEHEKGMMIFGLKVNDTDDDSEVKAFLKNEMKAPDEVLGKVKIKDIIRIGRNDPNKPPSLLVNFRHSSERNSLLPYCSNLRQGISVEKNIPREYQKKYKEFKAYARDFKRINSDVQTQIIFESCQMILRYRKKGNRDLDFVRLKEFCPEPTDDFGSTSTSTGAGKSRTVTPTVDMSATSSTKRSIIVTGVKTDLEGNEFNEKWKDFLGEEFDNVENIEKKDRDIAIITCKTWAHCNPLVAKVQQKAFLGHQIKFTIFSPTDPASS